jgi:hypothetical protein
MRLQILKLTAFSPEKWPCDYHSFGPSNEILKLTSDDDIRAAVLQRFPQLLKGIFCKAGASISATPV